MFSIDIIKAKAKAKATEVSSLVEKVNSVLVEANKVNSPKVVKLSTCIQQVHAMESVVNGTIVEKVASVGMVYYPYNEAPLQHSLFSSVVTVAKIKRLGLKQYIVYNAVIAASSYLVTK